MYLTISEYKKFCRKKFGKNAPVEKIKIDKEMLGKLTQQTNIFTNDKAKKLFFYW